MIKQKFMVREQNPLLIAMFCMLITWGIVVIVLDSLWLQRVGIIVTIMYAGYCMYKLIRFIRDRNKFKVMEISEEFIRIANKEYHFNEIKKIIIIDHMLDIRKNKPLSFNIFVIKKEEKAEMISRIREVMTNKNILTRLE